jgi:hypothetical protein
LEVAYKNLTFGNKVEGKTLFSFGAQKPVYDVLTGAGVGSTYTIGINKNEGGFNEWVNIQEGAKAAPQPARPEGSINNTATPAPKSNYETPEERAKKQIYIVRQSSISSAISALSIGAKTPPKIDDVITTAKAFEDFVFGNSVAESFKSLEDPEVFDDIPL